MHFANEYALQDGLLQVLCVSQNGCVRRSDAFIFVLNGEVILLDSGLPEMHYALMKLLELRSVFLSKRESELENKEVLLDFQDDYPGVLNGDNLADILQAAREKKSLHDEVK